MTGLGVRPAGPIRGRLRRARQTEMSGPARDPDRSSGRNYVHRLDFLQHRLRDCALDEPALVAAARPSTWCSRATRPRPPWRWAGSSPASWPAWRSAAPQDIVRRDELHQHDDAFRHTGGCNAAGAGDRDVVCGGSLRPSSTSRRHLNITSSETSKYAPVEHRPHLVLRALGCCRRSSEMTLVSRSQPFTA